MVHYLFNLLYYKGHFLIEDQDNNLKKTCRRLIKHYLLSVRNNPKFNCLKLLDVKYFFKNERHLIIILTSAFILYKEIVVMESEYNRSIKPL